MKKLEQDFYDRSDVLKISKELLGKVLVTKFGQRLTAGRIVETEAYAGEIDRASHAWGGRRTNRTEVMYGAGGTAYVYLCYGIHQMFNVVTNQQGIPHAILVRAAEPLEGIDIMLERTGKKQLDFTLTKGPGNVGKAFGFHTRHTGLSLLRDELFIADDGYLVKKADLLATPRIGVDYAGDDAALPYRFIIRDNPYVSGKKIGLVKKEK
ncbi:DNA-3-methyladenine glycosylase [Paraflavitalea sp. CAU 1676]|uniref:DNA-3-methyladenine glycosylase n=1 Tax=Paraflavitalea sp. CAU 1676 TaxID=3032598 RepID=UPI0023DCCD07|nr:DNA-3-methyladenine glycosylase [Paraflavitalea sp. CAU 1676]MDF2193051.1 DNA-3-methyladenine glycosylase [Paraflavitalea sp. CAU 1676]